MGLPQRLEPLSNQDVHDRRRNVQSCATHGWRDEPERDRLGLGESVVDHKEANRRNGAELRSGRLRGDSLDLRGQLGLQERRELYRLAERDRRSGAAHGVDSWLKEILAGRFFQNWDPERHVKRFDQVIFEAWQPRWISIDWGFEHATVVLWWARVRIKTELDKNERSILLVYRQLVLRHTNEELVAERIVNANHTGDKFDRIGSIFLSPDRFAKIDQHHSIADKMGDVFVRYDLPRPDRANNRRVDGWRLCYTLLDTDGIAVLDNCRDVIESIPQLQRDEKNVEDAQKEGNDLFLDVCESFRYGVMSYASEQNTPQEIQMQRRIQKIEDPSQKYMEYLRLSSRPAHADIAFTLPTRRR